MAEHAIALAPAAGSAVWDIRLQCTVCGFRVRRHRNDYNGALLGPHPTPTITTMCSNCTCNAGYPKGDVSTIHFVDYATKHELEND